jgi:hypothetical protein
MSYYKVWKSRELFNTGVRALSVRIMRFTQYASQYSSAMVRTFSVHPRKGICGMRLEYRILWTFLWSEKTLKFKLKIDDWYDKYVTVDCEV